MRNLVLAALMAYLAGGADPCHWDREYRETLSLSEPANWAREPAAAAAARDLRKLLLASKDRQTFWKALSAEVSADEQVLIESIEPRRGEYIAVWAFREGGTYRAFTMKGGTIRRRSINRGSWDGLARVIQEGELCGYVEAHCLDCALIYVSYDAAARCGQVASMEPVLSQEPETPGVRPSSGVLRSRHLILALLEMVNDR